MKQSRKEGRELLRKARHRNRKHQRRNKKQGFASRLTPNNSAEQCPYCGEQPMLINGVELFGDRSLAAKIYHLCKPCGAWVGCYPGTIKPLGILAKPYLRKLRKQLHELFDPLWQEAENPTLARSNAYAALADAMEIDPSVCHFGMMDERQCEQALEVVGEMRSCTEFSDCSSFRLEAKRC